jgi:nucleoside-diphosphate-sugar epimerase
MRALVTGGHGFLGSHLCERLLAEGHHVRVLARSQSDLRNVEGLKVEIVRGDVTDFASLCAAVDGVEWVFHLAAALRGFREEDFFRVNAAGTRNVAEACRQRADRLERLVVVSSLAAAGPSPGGRAPRTEEMPEAPLTWYGRSKLDGDRAVQAMAELPSVIVRPPIVFGPRERDAYRYFGLARRGLLPVLGARERFYSLVYGPDLATGLVHAARTASAPGRVFFLTGPEVVTWTELGRLIAGALGVIGRVVRVPEPLGVLAGEIADVAARVAGHPLIFNSQKVIEMRQPAWVASPERTARELGWTAPTPLPDAIAAAVRWYRDHGWL